MYTSLKILTISLIVLISSSVFGADVTLMWDRPSSAEQELITHGYRIYTHQEGEDYNFTSPSKWGWKGQLCSTPTGEKSDTCTITFKDINTKTYFVAKAYTSTEEVGTTGWVESEPSNEVVFIPPDYNAIDDDGDGFSEDEGDCNDLDSTIYPGGIEVCDDQIDNDCDGSTDEDCEEPPITPEKVEIKIQAVQGSYLFDGTNWYKITDKGLEKVQSND